MADTLRLAFAQINPTVGDVAGNRDLCAAALVRAEAAEADLLVLPELCLAGYPPDDLVLKPRYIDAMAVALDELAALTKPGGTALLVGAPMIRDGELCNCAALLDGGAIVAVRAKHDLPNYGVFDDKRIFAPGPLPGPINFRDTRLGVMVCEDMWRPEVTEYLQESGAEILIVINGSPFESDKQAERLALARARVTESGLPLIYVNLLGGQDEVVFDGASFAVGRDGALLAQAPAWTEAMITLDVSRQGGRLSCAPAEVAILPDALEALHQAMVLALRDYVDKNRFPGVILGLSGGIDSALAAAVAVDALGAERVRAVMMPSPYTSEESLIDAAECARLLGIRLDTVSIGPAMAAFETMLAPLFDGRDADTTEENLQSRARGVALMAISNKFGPMVLSTGNKSEMSVGYATLYGDMCGGYAILKDVYKTTVFELCRWRNRVRPAGVRGPAGPVMPPRVITKPPSAELKPNQTDQDSLPPYDVLDAILHGLIEEELSVEEIAARGHPPELVDRVWRMVIRAEYKRRQAPPGVKLTRRAFGRERRYPITNGFARLDLPKRG